jgi:hypothetical protein
MINFSKKVNRNEIAYVAFVPMLTIEQMKNMLCPKNILDMINEKSKIIEPRKKEGSSVV